MELPSGSATAVATRGGDEEKDMIKKNRKKKECQRGTKRWRARKVREELMAFHPRHCQ